MGFETEFNWALKLRSEEGLDEEGLKAGESYDFSKEGDRIYPVDIPIDLINRNWEAVAKVIVTRVENSEGETSGKYRVLKIYKGEEKEILTDYWRETVQFIRGDEISDFSDVSVT